jgi:ectoine hydroxylase-related dioxygenase (phytanoyl-CoA dioxygenase family)
MADYGVLEREEDGSEVARQVEELRVLGYTTLESGYDSDYISRIGEMCQETAKSYRNIYENFQLDSLGEANIFRAPALLNPNFLEIASHAKLRLIISRLISGKFYLNQQNLVINPPKSSNYSQLKFHRDLPYQHYVSSRPLAINALYAVDDFTLDNGTTFILPATHKIERFPSQDFIDKNQVQIEVKAGTFLILDCMVYHAAAHNTSSLQRVGVNHVYSTVMFKPQIDWACAFGEEADDLHPEYRELLGLEFATPNNVEEFLQQRQKKLG